MDNENLKDICKMFLMIISVVLVYCININIGFMLCIILTIFFIAIYILQKATGGYVNEN